MLKVALPFTNENNLPPKIAHGYTGRSPLRHPGIDLTVDGNIPPRINACLGGYVSFVGVISGAGQTVAIDTISRETGSYNLWTFVYCHLSSLNVRVGDKVSAGQFIGTMGSSGTSKGLHLHLTVAKNRTNIYNDFFNMTNSTNVNKVLSENKKNIPLIFASPYTVDPLKTPFFSLAGERLTLKEVSRSYATSENTTGVDTNTGLRIYPNSKGFFAGTRTVLTAYDSKKHDDLQFMPENKLSVPVVLPALPDYRAVIEEVGTKSLKMKLYKFGHLSPILHFHVKNIKPNLDLLKYNGTTNNFHVSENDALPEKCLIGWSFENEPIEVYVNGVTFILGGRNYILLKQMHGQFIKASEIKNQTARFTPNGDKKNNFLSDIDSLSMKQIIFIALGGLFVVKLFN